MIYIKCRKVYTYPDEDVTSRNMIAAFADFAHFQFGALFRGALTKSLDGLGGSSHL